MIESWSGYFVLTTPEGKPKDLGSAEANAQASAHANVPYLEEKFGPYPKTFFAFYSLSPCRRSTRQPAGLTVISASYEPAAGGVELQQAVPGSSLADQRTGQPSSVAAGRSRMLSTGRLGVPGPGGP